MARVVYTESAQADLLDAWSFIAQDSLEAADRVLDTIEREASILASQPMMGRLRPELAEALRSWPTSMSYILYYLADASGITVVRVLHHARDVQRMTFPT